ETARDALLLAVAVPAPGAVVGAPAPEEHPEKAEEQETAEQREQESKREEAEAPAIRMRVVRDRNRPGGRRGLDDGLAQAGVVRADRGEAADDEDRDEGEERTHW